MKFTTSHSRLGIWGLILVLTALLAVASQAYAFRFVVLADSPDNETNQTGFNQNALEYLRGRLLSLRPKPEMIFFLGDLVTKAYSNTDHAYIPDWKNALRPLAQAGIKVYTNIGNRDLYPKTGWPPLKTLEAEFQALFSPADPDFAVPDNGPPNYKYLAYTVSHPQAFFVVLDTFGFKADNVTNWDNGLDAEQLNWFQDQAAQATAKFRFALSHGPAFSPEGWSVDQSVQKQMWGIMQTYQFDAYFCGHEHIYSRWLINKKVDPSITREMTQVLTGSAGALPDQIFKVKQKRQEVRAYSLYNYVIVDVDARGAHFQTIGIDVNAGKYTAKVIDRFNLTK